MEAEWGKKILKSINKHKIILIKNILKNVLYIKDEANSFVSYQI